MENTSLSQPVAAGRRPWCAGASVAFGVVTLLLLAWPGGEGGARFFDSSIQDMNFAQLILGLLLWALLTFAGQAAGFILLLPALLRRERPVAWLIVAALLQVVIALVLWGESMLEALQSPF